MKYIVKNIRLWQKSYTVEVEEDKQYIVWDIFSVGQERFEVVEVL